MNQTTLHHAGRSANATWASFATPLFPGGNAAGRLPGPEGCQPAARPGNRAVPGEPRDPV